MNRNRLLGLAVAAAFASGGVVAAMASAEGPVYKVSGKTLKASETRLLLIAAKETLILESRAVSEAIFCTTLVFPEAGQMQIQGLAAGNGAIGKGAPEFSGCTQTGNGNECEVENGKIKAVPLLGLLGYANASETGQILVLLEPEKGVVLTTIKYVGKGCLVNSQGVTGGVIGGGRVNGKPVLGGEGTETQHGEVTFPARLIYILRNGVLSHQSVRLELQGISAILTGTSLLLVDEGGAPVKWGIFG
jgi:hypothetical protein